MASPLGGIKAAEDLADDILDILPSKVIDEVRKRKFWTIAGAH